MQKTHVHTIQIALDEKLLLAADQAAARAQVNQSAPIRDALRQHLRCLRTRELENKDRKVYVKNPASEEAGRWECAAQWPEE